MKKITILVLLGYLLSSSGLQAMKQKTVPLSKEDVWLVHQTRIFPKNGCMVAGGVMRVAGGGTLFMPLTLEQAHRLADNSMSGWRCTVHWSLNSLVYPHEIKINEELSPIQTATSDRTDSFYVILEPLRAFKGKKLYGYWQDMFHIGGHQLSDEAIILVPEGNTSYNEYVGDYKGKIVTYSSDLRGAVEEQLKQHKVPVLYPCMKGLAKKKDAYYHQDGTKQAVMLDKKEYPCEALSECMALNNVLLDGSSHGGVQQLFLETIKPVRNAQGMNFFLKQLIAGGNACVVCKKKADECASKALNRCSKCKTVLYCSAECQRGHWGEHKILCKQLPAVASYFAKAHRDYLKYVQCFTLDNDWRTNRFEVLLQLIMDHLNKAIAGCTSKKELSLMQAYKKYVHGMLCDLYSPKEEYAIFRKQYGIQTLDGFLKFAYAIQAKYALLAAEFDTP